MPSAKPLRVGVIGAGWVAGDRHLPAYARHPATEVVAVYDPHRERAARQAARFGVPTATDALDAFWEQRLDLVSVCSPPFAHEANATAALAAGAHVFMEKPMAMNLAEAEAIAAAAARHGRLLCLSHNFLFSRSMLRLRRLIGSGEAGAVLHVTALQSSSPERRLPHWYPSLPAGLFFDESPHMLYVIASLLGEPRLLHAHALPSGPHSPQPVRSLHAVFASEQADASLSMVFEGPVSEWNVIVVCERLVLLVDLFRDISVVVGRDRAHGAADILRTSAMATAQHWAGFASSGARLVARRQNWGHERLIHAFIDAVQRGGPAPVPVSEALRVMRLMDEVLTAIGTLAEPRTGVTT